MNFGSSLLFNSWKNSISFKLNVNKCYFTSNIPKFEYNNSGKDNNPKENGTPERNNKPKFDNKWKEILGRTGPYKHSHVIAFEQLNSSKAVTAKKIHEILVYCNITTTDAELRNLLNTSSFVLTDLNLKNTTKDILKEKLGLLNGKQTIPGIYIFTHLTTGRKYVGSSLELAFRLNGYINLTHRERGLLIPLLKKENLKNFSLKYFLFIIITQKVQKLY